MTIDAEHDVVTVTVPRSAYRGAVPVPWSTHSCKVAPDSQVWAQDRGEVSAITLISWSSVELVGDLESLRNALDQMELAYDRLVNPPAATNPYTQRPSAEWSD